ncbi:type III secretion system YopJ family effector YopP [Achromobacter xylosoxidans]
MIRSISQTISLGGLLKKEPSSSTSNDKLEKIITQLESDILNGSWIDKNYSDMDVKLMPALVMQANNKFPEMNLNFVTSPEDLSIEVKNTIDSGVESSRFIVNMGQDGVHFGVIDYKRIEEKNSLILFEPARLFNTQSMGPAMLAIRAKRAIEFYEGLTNCHFSVVEMDIQRSSSECGIFSLALAKKLYIERDDLKKIHEDNVGGKLNYNEMPLPHDKLDPYLPATFYKHTQGAGRLDEYLNANQQRANTIVNKKNETLSHRFNNNQLTTKYGKKMSISAHKKRVSEYKKLLKP